MDGFESRADRRGVSLVHQRPLWVHGDDWVIGQGWVSQLFRDGRLSIDVLEQSYVLSLILEFDQFQNRVVGGVIRIHHPGQGWEVREDCLNGMDVGYVLGESNLTLDHID